VHAHAARLAAALLSPLSSSTSESPAPSPSPTSPGVTAASGGSGASSDAAARLVQQFAAECAIALAAAPAAVEVLVSQAVGGTDALRLLLALVAVSDRVGATAAEAVASRLLATERVLWRYFFVMLAVPIFVCCVTVLNDDLRRVWLCSCRICRRRIRHAHCLWRL
jgi:hypothetical protein